jgi:hypothetical protein
MDISKFNTTYNMYFAHNESGIKLNPWQQNSCLQDLMASAPRRADIHGRCRIHQMPAPKPHVQIPQHTTSPEPTNSEDMSSVAT